MKHSRVSGFRENYIPAKDFTQICEKKCKLRTVKVYMDVSRTFKKFLKDSFLGDGSDNIFFQATNVKAKKQPTQFSSKENLGGKQEHGKGFLKISSLLVLQKKLLATFIFYFLMSVEARKIKKIVYFV